MYTIYIYFHIYRCTCTAHKDNVPVYVKFSPRNRPRVENSTKRFFSFRVAVSPLWQTDSGSNPSAEAHRKTDRQWQYPLCCKPQSGSIPSQTDKQWQYCLCHNPVAVSPLLPESSQHPLCCNPEGGSIPSAAREWQYPLYWNLESESIPSDIETVAVSPLHIFNIYFFSSSREDTVCLSVCLSERMLLLYSQQKGVNQKYIRCISGLVMYRQYIHHCSSQVAPHLAHGGESSIRSSAPLAWLRPPG